MVNETGTWNETLQNRTENIIILQWWENFYSKANQSAKPVHQVDPLVFLKDVKVVVMLLVGFSGAFIVSCLIFWMFYKNERILERLPFTKEYKRRKKEPEPESFYPIPGIGSFTSTQTLTLLAKTRLPGARSLKPAIAGLYSSKKKRASASASASAGDTLKATAAEDVNEYRSDRSSLHESDGEYDAPDNTFPAGGEAEVRKKGRKKKREQKKVKRHRKKNQFSTTIITSGESFSLTSSRSSMN